MKLFFKAKDGGPESNVTGFWLIESKTTFSIVILCFHKGSREAYHNHAFNAWSWVLKGWLEEHVLVAHEDEPMEFVMNLVPSFRPVYTPRERMHKVYGMADRTWVISFRGPWLAKWKEWLPKLKQYVTLTHGRRIVAA